MWYRGHLKKGLGIILTEDRPWIAVSGSTGSSCRAEWVGEGRWRTYCDDTFFNARQGDWGREYERLARCFWPQLAPYSPTDPHRLLVLSEQGSFGHSTWIFLTGFGPIRLMLPTDMQELLGQRLELSEARVEGRIYTAPAETVIKRESWGRIKELFQK